MGSAAFIEPKKFVLLLTEAKAGSLASRDEIFLSLCERQAKIYLRDEYKDLAGEVFICFCEALKRYELSKKPPDKDHIFWFGRFFKHRLRFAMQTHRRLTHAHISLSAHAVRQRYQISVVSASELDLAEI